MRGADRDDSFEDILADLPADLRQQVFDYAVSLRDRQNPRDQKERRVRMDWAGGLKDLRDKYTSVGLQHAARDLWG